MAARIVLAVRESQYIEPLLHYLHHSEYGEMLRITAFSRMDAFIEFMRGRTSRMLLWGTLLLLRLG